MAVDSLRPGGRCVLLGAAPMETEVHLDMGALLFGRSVIGVIEGDAVPRVTIPALIELWQAGRFAFDKLIETFALSEITEAAAASLGGEVVKPVLVP
jgi:aryl-alcohol dehydrogenase